MLGSAQGPSFLLDFFTLRPSPFFLHFLAKHRPRRSILGAGGFVGGRPGEHVGAARDEFRGHRGGLARR